MQFKKIEEIEVMPAKTQIDVVGVVEAVDQAGEIPRRDGSTVNKRNVTLRDDSNRSIELTLWDAYAFQPGNDVEQVGIHLHNRVSSRAVPLMSCVYINRMPFF